MLLFTALAGFPNVCDVWPPCCIKCWPVFWRAKRCSSSTALCVLPQCAECCCPHVKACHLTSSGIKAACRLTATNVTRPSASPKTITHCIQRLLCYCAYSHTASWCCMHKFMKGFALSVTPVTAGPILSWGRVCATHHHQLARKVENRS